MRKLVLGTLLLAGLSQALTGCIISSGDDDNGGGGGTGILYRVTWTCPDAADSITFTATDSASGASLSPDTFDCAAGTADILYDPGSYDIDIQPSNGAGDDFYDEVDQVSGNDGDLVQANFDFLADVGDNGFFGLTWTMAGEDPATGCDANGVADVVLVMLTSPAGSADVTFNCTDGNGVTDPLPLGPYQLGVTAEDSGGNALSNIDPVNLSLDYGDQFNDIGNVNFTF